MRKLSIVIPVYNGESSIHKLVDQLFEHLESTYDLDIVLVNDFSPDNSWEVLKELHNKYPQNIQAINLSRNFGEHNAVMAGYFHAKGEIIVNIDDDLQNPPSEIHKLVSKIDQGHEVVYTSYKQKKHHYFRNLGSKFTNAMATLMLKKPKDLYLSSFRAITAQLKNEIIKYKGPYPYIDGLILRNTARIGVQEVIHHTRESGESNYTLVKLLRLWSYMFLNFSVYPLRVASLFGTAFALLGFTGAIFVIIEKIFYPETQIGWSSLIISITLFSGIQLIILGLLGEYIGRVFLTQNQIPQYTIYEKLGNHSD
ncbi:glycosyltransferase family 2 protein [Halobacteriovorax sp. HLS]|uniref:glycosyltransferase family 2 protein n=1 Tax=Halobacteriovorax sp. HLS TaxID=2234000 RepID=UPI000FDC4CB5|nr:glycosyltransferase family 2 protein [Halobacteriovorax sp. HLS]